MNPLWNNVIVAGPDFVGVVDLLGTSFETNFFSTGFGNNMAMPLMRQYENVLLGEDQAMELLQQCFRVLNYRDARSLNRVFQKINLR